MFKKRKVLPRTSIVVLLLLLTTLNSQLQADELSALPAGTYDLDLSHASVVWKVNHMGFSTYVGRFTNFEVDLNLDTQDFSKSSVSVDIDVSSIATEYPWVEKEDFDKTLANDWFNVGDNPRIIFDSQQVSELSDGNASVSGDLTINGITRPVVLAVTLNRAATSHPFKKIPAIGFSAITSIDRTEWEVSKFVPIVGKDVAIEIQGEFTFAEN